MASLTFNPTDRSDALVAVAAALALHPDLFDLFTLTRRTDDARVVEQPGAASVAPGSTLRLVSPAPSPARPEPTSAPASRSDSQSSGANGDGGGAPLQPADAPATPSDPPAEAEVETSREEPTAPAGCIPPRTPKAPRARKASSKPEAAPEPVVISLPDGASDLGW